MVAVATLTVLVWLALLSWDNHRDLKRNIETGPYEPWQVVAVGVLLTLLLILALAVGFDPLLTSGTITIALTACMFVSFAILPPPDPGADLWPIGLAMVFIGTAAGCGVVYLAVIAVGALRPRR